MTVPCAACGEPAATFEAVPAGQLPQEVHELASRRDELDVWASVTLQIEEMLVDQTRIVRSGWTDSLYTIFRDWDQVGELLDEIARGAFVELRSRSYELMKAVTFHCSTCEASYCASCWTFSDPREGDAVAFTEGRCPHGHVQPQFP